MAVISKDKKNREDSQNTESTLKAVDIFDKDLDAGKDVEMDATSDAFDMAAPPPKGYYEVKLFLDKEGFKTGLFDKDDDESVYYSCGMECPIVQPEKYEGVRIFTKCSTVVGRGKANSTMGTLIVKAGKSFDIELPPKSNHLTIARLFGKLLKKEPTLIAEIDWRAWDKENQEFVIYGMEQFPKREDGTYNNVTEKKGKRLIGSAFVQRWLTKAEYKELKASGKLTQEKGSTTVVKKEEKVKETPKEEKKQVSTVSLDDEDFTLD